MKFKDIQIGDTIFIEKEVKYGWHSGLSFFVPITVTKTTDTQFTCSNNKRYKKDDGKCMGGEYGERAYLKGDKAGYNYQNEVNDQTHEMNKFIQKLNLEQSIIKSLENTKLNLNSGLSIDELNEIDEYIEKINIILNKTK